MKISGFMAASLLLLGLSITGLETKAQNLAQRPEKSTTSLQVLETPELSLEHAHLVLEKATAKAIELGDENGYRFSRRRGKS